MYLDTKQPTSLYLSYYHLLRHFKPDFQKTLIIGGAGYSFPKSYLQKYPGKQMDVVEIDPQMTQIARDHFYLDGESSYYLKAEYKTFSKVFPNVYLFTLSENSMNTVCKI